jgi:hypothetical protein
VHGQQHHVGRAAEVQHHEVRVWRVLVDDLFDAALVVAEDDLLGPDDPGGAEEQLALLPLAVQEDVGVAARVVLAGRAEGLAEHATENLEKHRHERTPFVVTETSWAPSWFP